MSKLLKGILVDPYRREVRRVEVGHSLDAWYALLRCQCVDVRRIMEGENKTCIDVWFDDEFLIKEKLGPGFRLPLQHCNEPLVVFGYGLILGSDSEGETCDLGHEGLALGALAARRILKLQFENWMARKLSSDMFMDEIFRTPETESSLSGRFRYLDNPVDSDSVRLS